ncbi:hypothetical protein DRN69_06840 [Candidatus Pacearchaeota archaeon]|nr:MAG: hypothetical protein DRN69_06840 [Candidatus Pacearchaeota archaeon]
MKHNPKITLILMAMFLITQFIGLYVVNHYSTTKVVEGEIQNVSAPSLPFGLKPIEPEKESDYQDFFYTIVLAFIIAISLLFLFTKFKLKFILKGWFFIVVTMALGIFFNSIIPAFRYSSLVALMVALPLAFIKIYKRDFFVHNITELLIYPGIAVLFVPLLNIFTLVFLLIAISLYDIWAVWHSGIMQKMAKFQIDKLNIFSGFFVPYLSKKLRSEIRGMKKSELKKKKIKVNVAILGGGDVIFPIIAAGVLLKTLGLTSSLFVIAGATLGVSYLFFFSEKKKFYPAMPFISIGIFIGIILSYLLL